MKIRFFTIPNLLTLANLLCGTGAAAAVLAYGDLRLAFWLLVAAALFDFFDGFVARLLGQSAPIGIQLDSLADMVSSGVTPAFIMLTLARQSHPTLLPIGNPDIWAWIVLALTACSALRLAKFNIDDTQHAEFCGLPTPAAGLFCASLGLLHADGVFSLGYEAILLVSLVTAGLLISPVRMFSLKFHGFGWSGNQLRYIFLTLSLLLIILLGAYAIAPIVVLYVVISFVRWLLLRRQPAANGR